MPVQRPYCESRSLASATRSWSSSLALFSTNASARPLDPRLGGMGKLRTKVPTDCAVEVPPVGGYECQSDQLFGACGIMILSVGTILKLTLEVEKVTEATSFLRHSTESQF
eukprot:g3724.t1